MKFADYNLNSKDLFANLNTLKNMANSLEPSPDVLKNVGVRMFANPNSSVIGERKALTPHSPRGLQDLAGDRFSSYLPPHLGHHESGISANSSNAHSQQMRFNENLEALLEMHRSNSGMESLGKRQDLLTQGIDAELPYQDPLYGMKRRLTDMTTEQTLLSPTLNNARNRHQSGPASPAHSYNGGFKLHSSRKNSDLQDLGPDLKPQLSRKSGEDMPGTKT